MFFTYQFSDPCISNIVNIDPKDYQTVDGIITKIASDLNLQKFQIGIKNPPNDKLISLLPNNYIFQLEIKSRMQNVSFKWNKYYY